MKLVLAKKKKMRFHNHRCKLTRQTGRGIGGIFVKVLSALRRLIVPNVKKLVSSNVGKAVGKAAAEGALAFGSDIISGKKAKEAGKANLQEGIRKIQESVSKLSEKKQPKKTKSVKRKRVIFKTKPSSPFFGP